MNTHVELESSPHVATLTREPPRSGRAVVEARSGPRSVRLREPTTGAAMHATIATVGYDEPEPADLVLYHTDDGGTRYVIGVLSRAEDARLTDGQSRDARRVMTDERGRVLFEYDPLLRRAVIHAPDGDLELCAPNGRIRVTARDAIQIESQRSVDVGVRGAGAVQAHLSMHHDQARLVAGTVTLAGLRAELVAARVAIEARLLSTNVERARHLAKVIDTEAERVVERARDAYREVTDLCQVRAGRLRWVAEKSASLLGDNVLLKARDRMKIKGERIHLA